MGGRRRLATLLVVVGLSLGRGHGSRVSGCPDEGDGVAGADSQALETGLERWTGEVKDKLSLAMALSAIFFVVMEVFRDHEWSLFLFERAGNLSAGLIAFFTAVDAPLVTVEAPGHEWDLSAGFDNATAASLVAGLLTVTAATAVALAAAPSLKTRGTNVERISLYYWSVAASGAAIATASLSLAVAMTQIRTFEVCFALASASAMLIGLAAVTSQRVGDSRTLSVALSRMFVDRHERRRDALIAADVSEPPGRWRMRWYRIGRWLTYVAVPFALFSTYVALRGNFSLEYVRLSVKALPFLFALEAVGVHWWFVALGRAWWFAKARANTERQKGCVWGLVGLTLLVPFSAGRLMADAENYSSGDGVLLACIILVLALPHWVFFILAVRLHRGPGMIEALSVRRWTEGRLLASKGLYQASLANADERRDAPTISI